MAGHVGELYLDGPHELDGLQPESARLLSERRKRGAGTLSAAERVFVRRDLDGLRIHGIRPQGWELPAGDDHQRAIRRDYNGVGEAVSGANG